MGGSELLHANGYRRAVGSLECSFRGTFGVKPVGAKVVRTTMLRAMPRRLAPLAFTAVGAANRKRRTLAQPRSWVKDVQGNGTFGRKKPVEWNRAESKTDRALREAAIVQHEFAKALRAQLKDDEVSTTTLAARAGLTIGQLRRILRGEVHLTLAEMRLLAAHAGLELTGDEGTSRP